MEISEQFSSNDKNKSDRFLSVVKNVTCTKLLLLHYNTFLNLINKLKTAQTLQEKFLLTLEKQQIKQNLFKPKQPTLYSL